MPRTQTQQFDWCTNLYTTVNISVYSSKYSKMDIVTAHCIVKLQKLSPEEILIAQHGIRDCFVQIAKLDQKEVDKWTANSGDGKNNC